MFASYNPECGAGNILREPSYSKVVAVESKKVGTANAASLTASFVTTAGLRRIVIIHWFLYPKGALEGHDTSSPLAEMLAETE